jgi:glyoxylase-like metal-dependent hydrolase (beta-lactamase superfamily II)
MLKWRKEMKTSICQFSMAIILVLFMFSCSPSDRIIVKHQVTLQNWNSYLIYTSRSKEAAIIDVGGPIDTLISCIIENDLRLKYFLITHCHYDHVMNLPNVRDQFPEANVCLSRIAFEDMQIQKQWGIENLGQEWLDVMNADPITQKMLDFDPSTFPEPDIYLEDNQILKLGGLNIKAIFTPGHSRGHMCFYTKESLFSGDVLLYRTVGHTGFLGGSKYDIIKSVRKLYSLLPDTTIVYPGHGQFTDIGSEKKQNRKITANGMVFGSDTTYRRDRKSTSFVEGREIRPGFPHDSRSGYVQGSI